MKKITILRRNLDLDYGPFQYILPENDITGASRFYELKDESILSYYSIPFVICNFLSSILFFLLTSYYITNIFCAAIAIFILFEILYYHRLNIKFKTLMFSITKCIGFILGIKFTYSTESAMATSLVNATEIKTFFSKAELNVFYGLLVFIEDRKFYKHRGFSLRSMVRALIQSIKGKRQGGSTITQQLCRSIFIEYGTYKKYLRRKIIEILLAVALEMVVNKQEILECYVASVRFEKDIMGLKDAFQFFSSYKKYSLTKCYSFFLIERLAMIHSNLKVNRVLELLISCVKEKLISLEEISTIQKIYIEQYEIGRIKSIDKRERLLSEEWQDIIKKGLERYL